MRAAQYFVVSFMALVLVLGLFATPPVKAQSSNTIVDVGDSVTATGTNWTYASGVFTVTGNVTITGTTAVNNVVVLSGVTANITLSSANIEVTGVCAFDMTGATVHLVITGTNKLVSAACAGLQAPLGSTLTIATSDGNDSSGRLTAISTYAGAGIGGSITTQPGGAITINSGTIIATSSGYGAGIGGGGMGHGGIGGAGGNITINGGDITATGGPGSAGIGGGNGGGNGGIITIHDGNVSATGGDGSDNGGAGIGGGGDWYGDKGGGIITITGGTVTATGGKYAAGIGGGSAMGGGGAGGDIAISGGAIIAQGGDMGAGIGGGGGIGGAHLGDPGGVGGSAGNILISGGNVSAHGSGTGAGIGGGGGGAAANGFGKGGTGGAAGNILIYGEDTQVTASKGGYPSTQDIGVGAGFSGVDPVAGDPGNVFVALTPANLTLISAAAKNNVLFTADPASANTVSAILPSPFNAAPFNAGTIALLTGLGPASTGKILSVITTLATQSVSFVLAGYHNSPISKTGTALMHAGASVNFAGADTVINNAKITVTAPVAGAAPNTIASGVGDFIVSPVSWSPANAVFIGGKHYTALITLTPQSGYTFAGGLTIATINGNNATVVYNADNTVTLSYSFSTKFSSETIPALNPAMLALLALVLMMAALLAPGARRQRVRG